MTLNQALESLPDFVEGDLRLILDGRSLSASRGEYAPTYRFRITVRGEEAGLIDLRITESEFFLLYAGQIGYLVEPPFRGHRYAARALQLLLPLARRHGLRTLWITCNPENTASRRTCELVGAQLVEVVDLPQDCEMFAAGDRQKCRYRLMI